MFKNYIKIAFRNLWKNRLLSVLNLIGLTVGLACIMTLMFAVYAYHSADTAIENQENLYYLKTHTVIGHSYPQTPYPLLSEIVNSSTDVVAATHNQTWNAPWFTYNDIEFQEGVNYVDTKFFKVFTLPFKYGNPQTALTEKYSIVLTEQASQRFFGENNPVGKTLIANDSLSFTITGVLERLSSYSTLRIGVLMPTAILEDNVGFKEAANWDNTFGTDFLRLRPNADIIKLEKDIMALVAKNYINPLEVKEIKVVKYVNILEDYAPMGVGIMKGAIATAIFILLVVLVNLLNLNTSVMYGRTKEVALHKILGGGKKSVMLQFCMENGLLVFTSLFIALLVFVSILLPELNETFGSNFGQIYLKPKKDYPILLYFILLGFVITLVVGVLPTLRYVALPISTAIKGKVDSLKSNFLARNTFITIQFALAIIFICAAVILNSQINYMQNSPLGFNEKNMTVARIDLEYKDKETAASNFKTIMEKLKANPYIESFSTSRMVPSDYIGNHALYYDAETKKKVRMRWAHADAKYLETFKIPLVSGRGFNEDLNATESNSVIINKRTMQAFGWENIENKIMISTGGDETEYKVVGVMEDFHYQDMQRGIEPLAHFYAGKQGLGNNRYLSLRITAGQEKSVLQSLENEFKKIPTRIDFKHEELTTKISAQYSLIEGILKIVNYVAFMTILISCLGLFGLISLIAKKRVKEIGIRKVLGAGVAKIIILLSKDFMLLIVLAACIAIPLIWMLMKMWLDSFAYSIEIKWWMLALGGFIALLITMLTVGIRALKAAIANPVKSLRTE